MSSGNSTSSWWRPKLPQFSGLGASPGSLLAIRSSVEPSGKFYVCISGKTLNSHNSFIDRLKTRIHLQQVDSVEECDFILGFCPIVSRAGTDIEAAVKKLQNVSDTKPTVLVVLYHTFDTECVVPNSSKAVHRKNMIAVDCLFHEDHGLLQCGKNNESLTKTSEYIKSKVKELQNKGKKEGEDVGSEQRNTAKSSDAPFKYTNTKPKTTNKTQERENAQHDGDQQLNPITNIEKAQILVEKMEKGLVERQKEIEEVKNLKQCFETTQKTLFERDAELMDTKEKLQNATEQIKEKNTKLENMKKLLSEKETQLKNTDKELETSTNKLETLGQELQDKERQLQDKMIVLEQQKTELEETNKRLEEKESLLTERETQLQEKNRLLTENTQTLQMTLEENDKQVTELKEEFKQKLMEKDKQIQEKERQLESLVNELETSKQKLMVKEQIQQKERLLSETAQTQQMKDETLEQQGTQFKQENEQEQEECANTGSGELPGTSWNLDLEIKSQGKKDQPVEEIIKQIEDENTDLKNSENLTQDKGALSKGTNTELENMAKEPQERKTAVDEGDQHLELKVTQVPDTQIQAQETEGKNVEKSKEFKEKNEDQKVQDTHSKEEETVRNEFFETKKNSLSDADAAFMQTNEKRKNGIENKQLKEEEINLKESETEGVESDTQFNEKDKSQKNETVEEQSEGKDELWKTTKKVQETQLEGKESEPKMESVQDNLASQEQQQEEEDLDLLGDGPARATDN